MEMGGSKEHVAQTATRVAESVLDEEDEEDVVVDDDLLRLATKRKISETEEKTSKAKKASKKTVKLCQSQEQSCLSDSFDSETRFSGYALGRIKKFLQETKGMRVKVEDFFPDLKLLVDSIRFFLKNTGEPGQPGFTDQKVYRQKKMVLKVSADASTQLEADISPQELWEALQSLKPGKAPGLDGLPAHFYKAFWLVVGEDLLSVLRDSLVAGRLPLSCRRAVLTLLPKKEEGGQGLVHLASRGAAFRLQFIQRLLTGPADLVWRPAARAVLASVLGTGTGGIHVFNGLWKMQTEPIIYGTCFNVSQTLGVSGVEKFVAANITTLGQVVDLCGPHMEDAAALSSAVGVSSVRLISNMLRVWRDQLSSQERSSIVFMFEGLLMHSDLDPFPAESLDPDFKDCCGWFLEHGVSGPTRLADTGGQDESEEKDGGILRL
ncbi:hypothetical protein L3Q82_007049 [Scortum barcoo]|uniref:Uncharacterized protein n=1 Tax=Scortum barcoo TaxID=214431 RepID=A0ACB8WVW6_9TELE|nr:hypothetical protein L3Q82_007049 [Scortum barcoo]